MNSLTAFAQSAEAVVPHDIRRLAAEMCPFLARVHLPTSVLESPYRVASPVARLCAKIATARKLPGRNAGRWKSGSGTVTRSQASARCRNRSFAPSGTGGGTFGMVGADRSLHCAAR